MIGKECVCQICGRIYNYNRTGYTYTTCNSCIVNRRRFKLRKKVIEYLGGKCSDCGYSECLGSLNAHHIDPSIKSFSISGSHARSWSNIQKELDKCILLCANCHQKRHHNCERYNCG